MKTKLLQVVFWTLFVVNPQFIIISLLWYHASWSSLFLSVCLSLHLYWDKQAEKKFVNSLFTLIANLYTLGGALRDRIVYVYMYGFYYRFWFGRSRHLWSRTCSVASTVAYYLCFLLCFALALPGSVFQHHVLVTGEGGRERNRARRREIERPHEGDDVYEHEPRHDDGIELKAGHGSLRGSLPPP